jgi:hypothetical protein
MWAEVSSLLHTSYTMDFTSPIKWRCLLRVLSPVRRPVTALDCVLLKDRNLALAPRQGPEINSRACLWVSPRPRHHFQCRLTNQRLILLRISCLEAPKAGSGPTRFGAETSLVNSPVRGLLYHLLMYIVKVVWSVYLIKCHSVKANRGVVVNIGTRCLACTLRRSGCCEQIRVACLCPEMDLRSSSHDNHSTMRLGQNCLETHSLCVKGFNCVVG